MSTNPSQVTEREELLELLKRSEDKYVSTVDGLSEQSAQARLNEDSWSILEIAEHVAVAEHGMSRALELAPEGVAATPDAEFEARLRSLGTDRTKKTESPDAAKPKGRWKSLAEALQAFRASRAKSMAMVQSVPNLRMRSSLHPFFGKLDGYQLVLIMAQHCERHALQIEEIKEKRAKG